METATLVMLAVCAAAFYPTWQLLHRAFFNAKRWGRNLVIPGCLVISCGVAMGLFYIPFAVNAEKTLTPQALLTDFVLYAIVPAASLGLLFFVWNQLSNSDSPKILVLAAGACLAVFILPGMLYFYGDAVMERHQIVIESTA